MWRLYLMLNLLELQKAANHEGCEHLNRLRLLLGGYNGPLFVLACKHSALFIDIQYHIDMNYGSIGYFGGYNAKY